MTELVKTSSCLESSDLFFFLSWDLVVSAFQVKPGEKEMLCDLLDPDVDPRHGVSIQIGISIDNLAVINKHPFFLWCSFVATRTWATEEVLGGSKICSLRRF